MLAVYVRVSTDEQHTSAQLNEITTYLKGTPYTLYEDAGLSGRTDKRPALQRLLADTRSGKITTVVVYKLDRLFRSLSHLLTTLQEWEALKITFISVKDNLDMSTPVGRLLCHLLGAFGQFECDLIRERVTSGLKNAKVNGTRSGKPIGRPLETSGEQRGLVRSLKASGASYRAIYKATGVSVSSVARIVNQKK